MYFDPNAPQTGALSCSELNDLCATDIIKSPDHLLLQNKQGGTCRVLEGIAHLDVLGNVRLADMDAAERLEHPEDQQRSA
jgi:hypothetical protein